MYKHYTTVDPNWWMGLNFEEQGKIYKILAIGIIDIPIIRIGNYFTFIFLISLVLLYR